MDPRFEIAIARKHGSGHQVEFADRLLDFRMERPRIADAGRATITDHVESQLVEILLQPSLLEIIRNDARTGRE
jgi:hypothetical protein